MKIDYKHYYIYTPQELLAKLRSDTSNLNPQEFKRIGIEDFSKVWFSMRRQKMLGEICRLLHQKLPGVTEHLYIPDGNLEQLPDSLWSLESLIGLDIRSNKLKNIPSSISKLTQLEYLVVLYNPLRQLPKSISSLQQLKFLSAVECPLNSIPASFGKLGKLNVLELDLTMIDELPWQLKNCPLINISISRSDGKLIKIPNVLAKVVKNSSGESVYQQAISQYPSYIHKLVEQRKYFLSGSVQTLAQADNHSLLTKILEIPSLRSLIFSQLVGQSPDENYIQTEALSQAMVESYRTLKNRRNSVDATDSRDNNPHLFFSPLPFNPDSQKLSSKFNLVEKENINQEALDDTVTYLLS